MKNTAPTNFAAKSGKVTAWQDFGLSVLIIVLLPAAPLGIEYLLTEDVSRLSLVVASAMYAMSLGAASRVRLCSIAFVIVGGLMCAGVGYFMNPRLIIPFPIVNGTNGDAASAKGGISPELDSHQAQERKLLRIEYRVHLIAIWTMIFMGIAHTVERFVRHIANDESLKMFYSG